MTEFLDLDDNCLEHIFNFCDGDVYTIWSVSKVCKRFNALVTTVHFPKQTKLKYYGYVDDNLFKEEFAEIMNCIGKYLVELEIGYTEEYHLDEHVVDNTYRIIGRSVGNRIRKLVIRDSTISEESMQAIRPVLQHLEELELDLDKSRYGDSINLRPLCPNLRRLHIHKTFSQNTGNWPRLEELFLDELKLDRHTFMQEEILEFMQNNPQLRKLKINCRIFDIQLGDIVQRLPNLYQLEYVLNMDNPSLGNILELQRLTHLKRLILRDVETRFGGIINNVAKLNGLVELQLQAHYDPDENYYEPNPQSIIGIALKMPQLQVFGISFCRIEEETILEFLRFADNLREIYIHRCIFDCSISKSML